VLPIYVRTKETCTVTSSRRRAIAAGALLAAVIPALAACGAGFTANTNKPYAPTEAGVLISAESDGPFSNPYEVKGIQVPQAFILGPDSGAQIAAGGSAPLYLTLTTSGGTDTLTAVTPDEQKATHVTLPGPVQVTSEGLARTTGALLQGLKQPLRGGEYIQLRLQFQNAGEIPLTVPVVTRSREFATLPPAPQPTETAATPTETPEPSPSPTTEP